MNREQHGELAYWYWGVKGWYPKEVLRLITLKAKRQTFLTSKFLGCHSIGHVSHLDIIFFFCMIELLCGFLTCFDMTNTLLYFFWLILATLPWINMYKKKNGFHSQYLVNTMKRNDLRFFFTIFTNEFYLFYTSFSIHPSNSRDLIVNSPLENYLQELTSIRPWWQLLPDKFEYSQYLFAEQCVDIIREKSIVYHFWELKD